MKELAVTNTRQSRKTAQAYPKKRPSPHGITKSRSKKSAVSSLLPPPCPAQRTPPSAKAVRIQQRLREAQILALRREGIILEEEYREEIQHFMHDMERYTMCSLSSMDQQPEIRWHMRPCLVDFIVEVHFTFRLRPETLYLALNIVDRYVSRRIVFIKHYQLVGCAALWIAAKYEDAKDRVPTVQDLASICRETYEESAFIQMEGHVLATIQWALGHPTAEAWLRVYCIGPNMEDQKVQHVARFLMEITLFYRDFVRYVPSAIALGALTLARQLCGQPRRIYDETEESMEIVELLDNRLAKHVNDLSETLVKKYSYAFFSKAATFVVQFYLQGGRFDSHPYTPLDMIPTTPSRSPTRSGVSTPMSSAASVSDMSDFSDDMPQTPTSPSFSSDPFSGAYMPSEYDKENGPAFEPTINKHKVESVPDHFLPHDFVTLGRTALHNVTNSSPRVVLVS